MNKVAVSSFGMDSHTYISSHELFSKLFQAKWPGEAEAG